VSWRNSKRARGSGEGKEILYFSSSLPSLAFFFTLTPNKRVAISPRKGIQFAHVGLESGMVFVGTTAVYKRVYHFNSKINE